MLGSPLGHDAFVAGQLNSKREEQDRLLQRIPALDSLQAAWLLLLFCAAPRANYLLRILPPHLTADYAVAHDVAVARCFAALLEHGRAPLTQRPAFEPLSCPSASVDLACARPPPIAMPRIGRPGATRSQSSVHALVRALSGEEPLPSTAAAVLARAHLRQIGFDPIGLYCCRRPPSTFPQPT